MSSNSSAALAQLNTPTGRLVVVAALSSSLTLISILSTQAFRRRRTRKELREEVERSLKGGIEDDLSNSNYTNTNESMNKSRPTSEVIIRESLARNYVYFGEEGMKKIRNSFVIIVGLGGVGSAVATMLVRSGVGRVRLIDFDQVSLSSLNRHSTATLAQVGTPKVVSCKDYYKTIAPWVEVEDVIALFGASSADTLLAGNPDWVVDCIDNIDSKIELLAYCHNNKIPVFASLGAAAKSDPSRIQIADISNTFEDPLAKSVRRRLRILGIESGIPVVYSTEKPRPEIGLIPLPEDEFKKGAVDELSPLANFRVRILPVLGSLPAMFGNAAATFILNELGGFKMEPLPVKDRHKIASQIYRHLASCEQRLNGTTRILITEADISYIYEEIHRMRAVQPLLMICARPSLLRWNKNKGLEWDNLALFEREAGDLHELHCLVGDEDPAEYWGSETNALVEKRFNEERRIRHFRL